MTPIIAIDPGASGGIAVLCADGTVRAEPMAEGMTGATMQIQAVAASERHAEAVMERVGGYMPGNSGPAACKFARHCGHLEAALYLCGVPTVQVAPQTWQKHLGALPKDKMERKRAIRELMARRYPHLTVTLKTADALGILTWRMETK